MILLILERVVSSLDKDGRKYKARALHIPSIELKTVGRMNGYRIEIITTWNEFHGYRIIVD